MHYAAIGIYKGVLEYGAVQKLHFVKPPAEPQNLDLPALNLTTLQHKAQQEYQVRGSIIHMPPTSLYFPAHG